MTTEWFQVRPGLLLTQSRSSEPLFMGALSIVSFSAFMRFIWKSLQTRLRNDFTHWWYLGMFLARRQTVFGGTKFKRWISHQNARRKKANKQLFGWWGCDGGRGCVVWVNLLRSQLHFIVPPHRCALRGTWLSKRRRAVHQKSDRGGSAPPPPAHTDTLFMNKCFFALTLLKKFKPAYKRVKSIGVRLHVNAFIQCREPVGATSACVWHDNMLSELRAMWQIISEKLLGVKWMTRADGRNLFPEAHAKEKQWVRE